MKRTIRRVALLSVALVLIVGLCVPAFAAYPKVTLYRRPTTVRRGYYMYHTYYLNCGSYTYSNGARAGVDGSIYRRATGQRYFNWGLVWSGRGYQKVATPVYSNWPTGSYRMYVRTLCRPYGYGRWYFVRGFNWYFNVR